MTQLPKISKAIHKKYDGQAVAIVRGEIVAGGRDSYEAEQKAVKLGYSLEDIMTTFLLKQDTEYVF